MPPTMVDPEIPEDLADALRRAAAAVPPADLHPSGPVLRLQRRQRRHRLAVTMGGVAAAAAVIAVAAVNITIGDDTEDTVTTGTTRDVDVSTPETPADHGLTTPLLLPGTWTELLPDGTQRDLPMARPDDTPVGRPVRLEDGRLISVSIPNGGPYPVVLSVFDARGELLTERDIHLAERSTPQLIGAYDGKAVVTRTSNDSTEPTQMAVSTIDLTTFVETPLEDADQPGLGSTAGGQLVLSSEQCSLELIDLAAGHGGGVDLESCARIQDLVVSPTGRYVAVIVDQNDASAATGGPALQVVDIQSGDVVAVLALWDSCAGREGCAVTAEQAITWDDDDTAAVVVIITDAAGTEERHIGAVNAP